MKIKTFITLFILALFITALATEDADARKRRRSSSSGACSEGSMEFSSQFNLIYNQSEDLTAGNESETDFIFDEQYSNGFDPQPYLLFNYYIVDSLHLGGAIIYNGYTEYFGLDLKVGYAIPLSGNFLDISGLFGYGSFSDRGNYDHTVMTFGIEALFKIMLQPNASFNFGLELKYISPNYEADWIDENNGTTIAVPVGISVYF